MQSRRAPQASQSAANAGVERRAARELAPALALGVVGVLLALWYVLAFPGGFARTVVGDLTLLGVTLLSAGLCLRAARRAPAHRGPWLCFGLGCLAWASGQAIWSWHELVWRQTPHYPSAADVGYLLMAPCVGAGLALIIWRGAAERAGRVILLDTAIIIGVITALLYKLLAAPYLARHMADHWASAATVAWQLASFAVIILTAVALLWRGNAGAGAPLTALLGGLIAFTLGNVMYGHRALDHTYTSGQPLDLTWIEGFLCIGVGALLATRPRRAHAWRSPPSARWLAVEARTVLMTLSVLGVAVLGAYAAFQPNQDRVSGAAVIVIGALLAARVGYSALLSEHLEHRTRERDRLSAVIAGSTAINGTAEYEDLLAQLAGVAARAVGRERAEVFVFNAERTRIEASADYGFTPEERALTAAVPNAPVGAYAAERVVLATGQPAIDTLNAAETPAELLTPFRAIGKLQTLVSPLLAHGEVIGIFDTWTPGDTRPYDPEDVAALTAIGQQAGLAVRNASLLRSARRHATEQAALLRVAQAAASVRTPREMISEIARATLGAANAEACGIELWRPETQDTEQVADEFVPSWGGVSEVGARYPIAEWPSTRRVMTSRQAVTFAADDPQLTEHERASYAANGTHSVIVAPLILRDECLGIMCLYSKRAHAFSADDLPLVRELAAQVALAIERAQLYDALHARAETDGLTGLLNHRAVLEALDRELSAARQTDRPVAVLMVDLDEFKQANDAYGHQAGDRVLIETANVLRRCVREGDHVGRYGGDEFLVILPGVDTAAARDIAGRLHFEASTARVTFEGAELPLLLSAGMAVYPVDGATRQELITVADNEMYVVKNDHRTLRERQRARDGAASSANGTTQLG